jgi:phage/plasmid-associated DNA primase
MSPRKAATAKAVAPKAATAKAVAKKTTSATATSAKPAAQGTDKTAANGTASAEATALAARIERDLRDGRSDSLTPQAFQALMAALCKIYGTQLEAGAQFLPLASQTSASPTEVMTTTSALLKAANLAVFELGMWQSWTGR